MGELAKRGERWARRNGRSPYPVLTTEDIATLPVEKIAYKNSLCLMWATWPKLTEAIQVLQHWGFDYVTKAFVWVKLNKSTVGWHFGLGYHTHGNTEMVLIGKKGNGVKRRDKTISELIFYPRGEHSAKPPITRTRIEALYGDVVRLELFAREQATGWDCWGNEVPPSPGTEPLWPFIAPPYQTIIDEDEYNGMPPGAEMPYEYQDQEQMLLI